MSAKRIFAINAPQIHIANTTDNALGDITLRSTGNKGVHDILVKETNFKFSNGDVVISEGGSVRSDSLQDSAGNDGITFSSGAINFHNRTANNINLGTGVFDTSQINSLEYPGNSLDHELNQIETALSQKEIKTGHSAAKIATTNSSGELEYIKNKSLLDDIGTNTSSISTNTSNITTNTSNITTNTSNITTNTSNITTNTSNITTNTSNISTNTTDITDVSDAVVRKGATQTLTGTHFYDVNGQLTVNSGRFHIYNNADAKLATFSYTNPTNIVLTLPSSTGTLSLKSPVDTNTTNISTNTSNISTNTSNITTNTSNITSNTSSISTNTSNISTNTTNITGKLGLTGGTLTGNLQVNANLGIGTSTSYNFHIRDESEDFAINHNTGYNPDGYFLGTTTSTPLYISSNALVRMTIASAGEVGIGTYPATGYTLDVLGDTIRYKGVNQYAHSIILDRGDSYWSVFHSSHEWDTFNDSANKYTQASTTTGQEMFLNYYSSGHVNVCNGGGTLRHTGIANVSDNRLKHNEVDISGAVNVLKQLRPQKYFKTSNSYLTDNTFDVDSSGNYIDSSGNSVKGRMEAGFIAQEMLETDLAWLVGGGGTIKKTDLSGNIVEVEEMYNVNYDGLHAYTIKALQEQQEIIETLQKKLADEETKTAYFEMKINQLFSHIGI